MKATGGPEPVPRLTTLKPGEHSGVPLARAIAAELPLAQLAEAARGRRAGRSSESRIGVRIPCEAGPADEPQDEGESVRHRTNLREAKPRKRIKDLLPDIEDTDVADTAAEDGISEEQLALQIDADLGTRIWAGTTFEDRTGHLNGQFAQDLVQQGERSLMAQENYGEFEQRMLKAMGVANPDEPAGALWKFERQLGQEARLAWNAGMVAANADEPDTVLVSRSVLKDTTTPGCAAKHGLLIEDDLDGETPPYHEGCLCDAMTIPNPASEDPEIAAAGQEVLDQMAEDRASWGADPSDAAVEAERAVKPSRFRSFREIVANCS